jgi:hypothetical protein
MAPESGWGLMFSAVAPDPGWREHQTMAHGSGGSQIIMHQDRERPKCIGPSEAWSAGMAGLSSKLFGALGRSLDNVGPWCALVRLEDCVGPEVSPQCVFSGPLGTNGRFI